PSVLHEYTTVFGPPLVSASQNISDDGRPVLWRNGPSAASWNASTDASHVNRKLKAPRSTASSMRIGTWNGWLSVPLIDAGSTLNVAGCTAGVGVEVAMTVVGQAPGHGVDDGTCVAVG